MRACLIVLAGCSGVGSLEIDLGLPMPPLRPVRGQTITLVASPRVGTPVEATAPIGDMAFSAGDLLPASDVQLDLRMQDLGNRLVGYGRAPKRVDIPLDQDTRVTIPIRRPFVFASDGVAVTAYDASLDPLDPGFQSRLMGVPSPHQVVAVADALVVASDQALTIIDTATNSVVGSIPIGGDIRDVAPVPAARSVAVAHSNGMSIADLDTGTVHDVAVPALDRVAVGRAADGTVTAFGLAGRVAPPAGAYDACAGTSTIVAVDVTTGTAAAPVALSGIADIAAAPARPGVYAALPCDGKIAYFDGAALSDVAALERAAVIVATNERVWALGVHAATATCTNASGTGAPCTASAVATCASSAPPLGYSYVSTGANLIVMSIGANGTSVTELDLPPRAETMIGTDDPAHAHAQILKPLSVVPLDIVALPDGASVAVIAKSSYFITALVDGASGTIVLPCLLATTSDWLVADVASSTTTARVRTRCTITVGPSAGAFFPTWQCGEVPPAEAPTTGEYDPIAVGAIYGAR